LPRELVRKAYRDREPGLCVLGSLYGGSREGRGGIGVEWLERRWGLLGDGRLLDQGLGIGFLYAYRGGV
jgi:hypothetical protein